MLSLTLLAVLAVGSNEASGLTEYPAFINPRARVEAVIDKGPIQELIINCGKGTAIISYSKLERAYCTPKFACSPRLSVVISQTCGQARNHQSKP